MMSWLTRKVRFHALSPAENIEELFKKAAAGAPAPAAFDHPAIICP